MALRFGGLLREARLLLVCLSLAVAVVSAVVILLSVVSPVRAQVAVSCENMESLDVPGAQEQDRYCCPT